MITFGPKGRNAREIAGALLRAGVSALGDSHIENIEAMRRGARTGGDDPHTLSDAEPGAEVTFQLDYSALIRSMTSPFIAKVPSRPRFLMAFSSAFCLP